MSAKVRTSQLSSQLLDRLLNREASRNPRRSVLCRWVGQVRNTSNLSRVPARPATAKYIVLLPISLQPHRTRKSCYISGLPRTYYRRIIGSTSYFKSRRSSSQITVIVNMGGAPVVSGIVFRRRRVERASKRHIAILLCTRPWPRG